MTFKLFKDELKIKVEMEKPKQHEYSPHGFAHAMIKYDQRLSYPIDKNSVWQKEEGLRENENFYIGLSKETKFGGKPVFVAYPGSRPETDNTPTAIPIPKEEKKKTKDMREIKFRCWTGEEMLYEGWNKDFFVTKEIIFRYERVMQFIGLFDKNSKEIYEGDVYESWYSRDTSGKDIIRFKEKVEWELQDGECGYDILFFQNAEVIGNIYEHPHLLNSDKNDEPSVATEV